MHGHQGPTRPVPPALPARGVLRRPWREWALSVGTLGVYAIVVHHRTNRELRDYGVEVHPGAATTAFFPGVLLLVPFLITVHRTAARIAVAQETAGLVPSINTVRCTVTSVLVLLHVPYQQTELNRVWRADALEEMS